MITLAVDLSMKRIGWAIGEGWPIESGSIEGDPTTGEGANFSFMKNQLASLIKDTSPDEVIFPEYHNTRNADAAKQSLGLRALLLCLCAELGLQCKKVEEAHLRSVAGVDMRRRFTPAEEADFQRRVAKRKKNTKGVTKRKIDMKARVAKVVKGWGIPFKDDDEADAILILVAYGRDKF